MATVLNPVTFFKQVRVEMAKVIWPTRQETIKLTLVVIGVSIAIGLYIGGLDIILVKLTEFIIGK